MCAKYGLLYENKIEREKKPEHNLSTTGEDLLSFYYYPWRRERILKLPIGQLFSGSAIWYISVTFGAQALRPGQLVRWPASKKRRRSQSDTTGKCCFVRSIVSKMTRLCSCMQFKHLCRESTRAKYYWQLWINANFWSFSTYKDLLTLLLP